RQLEVRRRADVGGQRNAADAEGARRRLRIAEVDLEEVREAAPLAAPRFERGLESRVQRLEELRHVDGRIAAAGAEPGRAVDRRQVEIERGVELPRVG